MQAVIYYLDVVEFVNDSGKVCKKFQGVSDTILEDFVNSFSQQRFVLKTNLLEYATHVSDLTGLSQNHLMSVVNAFERPQTAGLSFFQNDAFLLNCVTDILASAEVYNKFRPYIVKLCLNFFVNPAQNLAVIEQYCAEKTVFVKCISSLNSVPRADFFASFKHSNFTEFTRLLKGSAAPELLRQFGTVIEVVLTEDYMMEYLNLFPEEEPKFLTPVVTGDELLLPPVYPYKVLSAEAVRGTFKIRLGVPCRWFLNTRTTNLLLLRKTSLKFDKTHLFHDLSRTKDNKETEFYPSICTIFPKLYLGFELMEALARTKFELLSSDKMAFSKNQRTILRVFRFFFRHLAAKNFVTPITLDELARQSVQTKRTVESVVFFLSIIDSKIKIKAILFSFNTVNYLKYKFSLTESKEARSFLSSLVRIIGTAENFYLLLPFIARSNENTEMLFDLNNIVRSFVDLRVTNRVYMNMAGNDFSYFIVNALLDSEALTKSAREILICLPYNEVQEKSLDFFLKLKQTANLQQLKLNFDNSKGFDQQCLLTIKSKLDFSDFNKVLVLSCRNSQLTKEQAAVFIQSYQLEYQGLKLVL